MSLLSLQTELSHVSLQESLKDIVFISDTYVPSYNSEALEGENRCGKN